jgi:hypothetical protein
VRTPKREGPGDQERPNRTTTTLTDDDDDDALT